MLPYRDRIRRSKGSRKEPIPDPVDIGDYDGAALPRTKKGELVVQFFAGKTNPHDVAPAADNDNVEPVAPGAQSSYDPWATWEAWYEAGVAAEQKLQYYRGLLGRRLYEALHDAALGLHADEIGGKRGDKRAAAIGKDRVQAAIERLWEERCTKSPDSEPI